MNGVLHLYSCIDRIPILLSCRMNGVLHLCSCINRIPILSSCRMIGFPRLCSCINRIPILLSCKQIGITLSPYMYLCHSLFFGVNKRKWTDNQIATDILSEPASCCSKGVLSFLLIEKKEPNERSRLTEKMTGNFNAALKQIKCVSNLHFYRRSIFVSQCAARNFPFVIFSKCH